MVISAGDGHSETTNANDSPHIHFAGEWADDECEAVRAAIEQVEISKENPLKAKPWICVTTYVEEQDARFYFASRLKLTSVFRGRSAQELVDAIIRRFLS